MNVMIGAKTDPGRRPNNEDKLLVVDVRRHRLRADSILVIADGMGGRNFGEKASAVAVETVQDTLVEMLAAGTSSAAAHVNVGDALASALRKANARVYELSQAGEENHGMGTTCVAAVIEGQKLFVGHAGDSRAYLLRDGLLRRLTDDHSYVAEQVRAGMISEEGARRSRFRNVITRAVGIEPAIEPDVAEYALQGGDTLLLCTDGLTGMVAEADIAYTLAHAPSSQSAADTLIKMANRNGGKDNITAIVARLDAGNRTQQFNAEQLAQVVPSLTPPATAPQSDEGAPVPPIAPRLSPGRRRTALWPVLSTLMIVFLLGINLFLIRTLHREGYVLQDKRPFVTKPMPPLPPPSLDLAHVAYAPPVNFYYAPVQGGLLALDASDGSVAIVTLSGQVVRLAHDGHTVFKYPEPSKTPRPDALAALPAESNQHFAVDPQGNLYVADSGARTISKYRPNGDPLGVIPARWLQKPASLAVAADGSIYVIDDERLKVIHAHPANPAVREPSFPNPLTAPSSNLGDNPDNLPPMPRSKGAVTTP